ncbi:sodium-dependent transporter [Lysinibacillus mangiferihumi]|uniref:Sodium-dependent transporter n=1 Tax=Lysinibacillus mangiferihumi TaxID=1130819 RepID=A0A4U2Y084_9BACI|nr:MULTISPECIES: sodium-dependent transporter [Lysinibacillus]MCS1382790.1 sodium-dependent transporter [Lysinibacillus sphaericus]TKI53707.1 sodium-dependent transporter [Lysinibacillus mangiferihumi]
MSSRDQFSTKIGFILAAAGSAIGLGAIWKFPYMAGTNGGSVFILLFILCTFFIGLPVLIAEFMIGRRGQKDAVTSFKQQAPGKPWFLIGWGGMIIAGLILSFYSVVGGWILSYLGRSLTFQLTSDGHNGNYADLFGNIISSPFEAVLVQGLFLLLTIAIVSGGIKGGIEKASTWMMPLLFIFFIVLVIRSLTLDGAMEGVKFMFVPDWSYLNAETFLKALGQAFFSLSVGIAVMITYASYLPKTEKIGNSAINVASMNIIISLLAGLVIFPAVFALGYTPDQGPGLVFIILPAVFEQLPLGGLFLTIFFILLLFATVTSSISMLEIVVAIAIGDKPEKRKKIAWIGGLIIFIFGIPSALSFGILSDVKILDRSIFDFVDFITNSVGMPIGALLISIFAGYYYTKDISRKELASSSLLFNTWYILIRYVSPIAILLIFIQGILPLFQ